MLKTNGLDEKIHTGCLSYWGMPELHGGAVFGVRRWGGGWGWTGMGRVGTYGHVFVLETCVVLVAGGLCDGTWAFGEAAGGRAWGAGRWCGGYRCRCGCEAGFKPFVS